MARVSTYLNFSRSTEEAFNFYKTVFGTEFAGEPMRFKDMPPQPGQPPLSAEDANLIMYIELPILAGHALMGTDAPESMGFSLNFGNSVTIMLEPDSREETERLYNVLAQGGEATVPLQDMFWGAYYGELVDRFGTRWMFNFAQPA